MLDLSRSPNEKVLEELPIFPLPNVVFLPGMVLPLNVFEPRYLELVDHALCSGKHIGVPLLRGSDDGEEGQPSFESVFGLGKLVAHQELGDGRRFIRLEGLGRVRALQELPQIHRFRRVKVEVLEEELPSDLSRFEVLKAQIEWIAQTFEEDDREMVESVLELGDPRIIVYAIASLIPNVEVLRAVEIGREIPGPCTQLHLQQACLEAPSCDRRIELLSSRAAALVDSFTSKGIFPATFLN